jgi:hypothetical protein
VKPAASISAREINAEAGLFPHTWLIAFTFASTSVVVVVTVVAVECVEAEVAVVTVADVAVEDVLVELLLVALVLVALVVVLLSQMHPTSSLCWQLCKFQA